MPNKSGQATGIPPKLISQAIDAAKSGSYFDLNKLADNVAQVPPSFYPELLNTFSSNIHSPSSSLLSTGNIDEKRTSLAFCSLKGIYNLSKTDLLIHRSLAERLLHTWATDALAALALCMKTKHIQNYVSLLVFYAMEIYGRVSRANKGASGTDGMVKDFQKLAITLWIEYLGDDSSLRYQSATLINLWMFYNPKNSLDLLFEIVQTKETEMPEEAFIASHAIHHLKTSIARNLPDGESGMRNVLADCSLMTALMHNPSHAISRAIASLGGVDIVLTLLNKMTRRIPAQGSMESASLQICATCFQFLRASFILKHSLLRKAIRAGLIESLAKLCPFFQDAEMKDGDEVDGLRKLLREIIPRDLTYIKTINLLSDTLKQLQPEHRSLLEDGMFGQHWKELESVTADRFVFLRFHLIKRHSANCGGCGKNMLKENLKKCMRCKDALYCSKACQVKAWQNLGHKHACGEKVSATTARRSRLKRHILEDILISDVKRYFTSAVKHYLGSLENFDPSIHIAAVDYSQIPFTLKIARKAELTSSFPWLTYTEATLMERIEHHRKFNQEHKANFIFCIGMNILGTQYQYVDNAFDMDELHPWQRHGAPELKRILPYVRVVAGEADRALSPEYDMVDLVMSFCGSSFEEFWKKDVEKIIFDLRATGGQHLPQDCNPPDFAGATISRHAY